MILHQRWWRSSVDGKVVEGIGQMNEAAATGESRLVTKEPGSTVYAAAP